MIKQFACAMIAVGAGCAGLSDPTEQQSGQSTVVTPTGADVNAPASSSGSIESIDPALAPPPVTSGTWTKLTNAPATSAGFGFMQLLTDGTVIISEVLAGTWWKLTPDITGSYLHGTWTQIAPMPSGYAPLYFGSGVLPDGRVMIEGGEYNQGPAVWTTLGAVYDPVANSWKSVTPPSGWSSIGDASAVVLANGTYMQSDCCSTKAALLNPTTLAWTATGTGKQGSSNDEESWTFLPDGTILTVDCNNTVNLQASEIYTPSTGKWTLGPNTANKTCDINSDGSGSHENGPAILRYDGTVYAVGGTGHNDIYTVSTKTWKAAADSPVVSGQGQIDSADGPAVLMPNGNELLAMSPGVFQTPTHMYEWNGTALGEVAAPPNAQFDSSYQNNFMLLPTGEVLLTDFSGDIELYTPATRTPVTAAVPSITSTPTLVAGLANAEPAAPAVAEPAAAPAVAEPAAASDSLTPAAVATLHPGSTYNVAALRMNGLSEAVAYGDDAHPATNYPIVRITITATHHVFYCRTFAHSTRAIGTTVSGTTNFTIPATAEKGAAVLELVANGIPSPSISINLK
jgi:hypothetical protein